MKLSMHNIYHRYINELETHQCTEGMSKMINFSQSNQLIQMLHQKHSPRIQNRQAIV